MVDESERRAIRAEALAVLRRNRRRTPHPIGGRRRCYTCPSPGHYPFQWFWDSCFHAVALAHLEPAAARDELWLLFAGQRADGFMPHVIFWDRRLLLQPRLYWCWLQSRDAGVPRRSALIQPPVIAAAVERYAEVTGDRAFVRRVLPRLDAYYDWLGRARDPDGDGLVTIVAPWESGMDHRPSYDAALGLRYPAAPRDLILVPRRLDLANRVTGYDPARLFRAGRFLVDDVLVNAVYADGLRTLARLHGAAGDDPAPWQARAARTEAALVARCRGDDGFFYDRDRRPRVGGDRLLRVRTVAGLACLLLASLTAAEAAPLLRDLADPTRFWAAYPLTSVAMDEPAYVPGELRYGAGPLLWRGPTWINLNWLLVRALRRRGEERLADELTAATLALVRRSGFREHYHPQTGAGLGARSFGWSTLVVDML
jgi:glycogen debranching enzyme